MRGRLRRANQGVLLFTYRQDLRIGNTP